MKTRKILRSRIDEPKIGRRRVYKDLEIAMENRALATHPPLGQERENNEITDWTEADADTLEG